MTTFTNLTTMNTVPTVHNYDGLGFVPFFANLYMDKKGVSFGDLDIREVRLSL